jgi:hypothetical protein
VNDQLVEEHGTNRGYDRHRQAGEQACPACTTAHADYIRTWRNTRQTAAAKAAKVRLEAARQRAHTRLSQRYPDEFQVLLDEELRRSLES